uniref:Glycosyltransferase 2-like domain-containing protein n=1 Tax=viral metagenome TaxID=1070528 RepID=A0A6C0KF39_9ZZZZ
MPTLTLIMIVKNESKIMTRCLDSIRQYVDHIVISDTGSTDSTPEIIENYLSENNIPGKVYRDQWKNFGYNRSKSVTNGQEWIRESSIDPSSTYFITIDADMLLCFHSNFNKDAIAEKQAWLVQQRTDCIQYYNTRLFRADLPYKCIGVTHEYWGCDGHNTEGKLDTVHIDDRGDGGCKSDKFTRDVALLTKGIEDEPKNERYYFYLAQSYADLGESENALRLYQKRIDIGGWNEEIFIAYKRRGELLAKDGKHDQAILEWIKGYEALPARNETLYRIIQHYRYGGRNQAAYLFLKQALTIQYPSDLVLFIEHPIYEYKLIEELSIIGYYVNKKREGLIACQYLMMTPSIPKFLKDSTLSNSFFYIPKIDSISHKVLSVCTQEPYISSSACFHLENNGSFKGVVRAVNYSLNDQFQYTMRDTKGTVRTKNYWGEFDSDGNQQICYELECTDPRPLARESHIKGFEDIRVVWHDNKLYGLGVHWEYGQHNHPSIVFLSLSKDENEKFVIDRVIPITYKDDICQKNWVLFSDGPDLCAIYSHHPLTILRIDTETGATTVTKEQYSEYDLSNVRGSAVPVRVGDDWIVAAHEVVHKDTRKYYHRLLRYSSDWELKQVSEPFYFNRFYVEFTLSVMYNKNAQTLIIPYSTKDNTTEVMTIDYNSIKWLPKDMKQWLALHN